MASSNSICIILPIFLCISIILCLIFFTFRATAHRGTSQHESTSSNNNSTSPCPEMLLDGGSSLDYLAMHTQKDTRRKMTDIRNVFLYDERVYVGDGESDLQPLLPGELYDDPLEQTTSVYRATRQDKKIQGKDSINWHGTNTLNTSWGWMA